MSRVSSAGNMSIYMVSALQAHGQPVSYAQASWVIALTIAAQGGLMPFAGAVERWAGVRATTLIGCLLLSCVSSVFTATCSLHKLTYSLFIFHIINIFAK